ncbi:MAG: energy transducer TonB, partial [Myxococcales bacterium]|nr:energy transducer TonB [Myxococcales bacterium]
EYPMAAQRSRQQGRVIVSMVVDRQGHVSHVSIRQSSGSTILDRAALRAIESMGDVPPPPQAVQWSPRPLSLPISYRLEVL